MKTLVALLLLAFTFHSSSNISEAVSHKDVNLSSNHPTEAPVEFKLQMEMGTKIKGRCIPDYGNICDVYIATEWGNLTLLAFAEKLLIKRLQFPKESLSPELINTHFPKNIFLLKADFSKKLKYKGKTFLLKMKAGKYKMKETKTGYIVDIPT